MRTNTDEIHYTYVLSSLDILGTAATYSIVTHMHNYTNENPFECAKGSCQFRYTV